VYRDREGAASRAVDALVRRRASGPRAAFEYTSANGGALLTHDPSSRNSQHPQRHETICGSLRNLRPAPLWGWTDGDGEEDAYALTMKRLSPFSKNATICSAAAMPAFTLASEVCAPIFLGVMKKRSPYFSCKALATSSAGPMSVA